ncbi:MAG: cytochrome b561 domain-containing protein [Nitratireductor sp.]
MWEWLLSSIDPLRDHTVGFEVAWHGRLMVFAWSFLIPIGIIAARFFKIAPRQKWPEELDNQLWWYTHQVLQYIGTLMMLVAIWLIWKVSSDISMSEGATFIHLLAGWTTVSLCSAQVLAGWLRGSKGGPTEVERTGTVRGDHYDMSERRKKFEHFHKTFGYICLLIAFSAVMSGLWISNAPNWMWLCIFAWWIFLIAVFVKLQSKGNVIDTYQAIWGIDPNLPGNKDKPIGWGIKKISDKLEL